MTRPRWRTAITDTIAAVRGMRTELGLAVEARVDLLRIRHTLYCLGIPDDRDVPDVVTELAQYAVRHGYGDPAVQRHAEAAVLRDAIRRGDAGPAITVHMPPPRCRGCGLEQP